MNRLGFEDIENARKYMASLSGKAGETCEQEFQKHANKDFWRALKRFAEACDELHNAAIALRRFF